MKMPKILVKARKVILPTKEEMNISEAKKLVKSLMSRFSIEEQSQIALQIREELIVERESQVKDAEAYTQRLKDDLSTLKKNHVNI